MLLTPGSRLSLNGFSLSSIGLTNPSLPAAALLTPLLALEDPTQDTLTEAIDNFRSYIAKFKAAAATRPGTSTETYLSNDAQVATAAGHLLSGYLATAIACAQFLANPGISDAAHEQAAEGVKLALEGTGVLYHAVTDHPDETCVAAVKRVHDALLGTPFDLPASLGGLLSHASSIAQQLPLAVRYDEARRKSAGHGLGAEQTATRAAETLSAISMFTNLLLTIPSLPLPDVKMRAADRKRWPGLRPRWIEMEARLAGCDLALSLALAAIEAVKVEESDGVGGGEEGGRGDDAEREVVAMLDVAKGFRVKELVESLDRELWIEGEGDSGDMNEESDEDNDSDSDSDDMHESTTSNNRSALHRIGDIVERLAEIRSTVYDAVLKDTPGAPRRRDYSLGATMEIWDKLGRELVATMPKVAEDMFPGEVDRWLELEERQQAAKRRRSSGPSGRARAVARRGGRGRSVSRA